MINKVVMDFIDAINNHSPKQIIQLMTNDHIFIDANGHTQSKKEMEFGWAGYFAWFPDYLVEITDIFEKENAVVVLGYASGTYEGRKTNDNKYYWKIPAAWKAVVENNKVKIWQVFANSKTQYDVLNK